MGSLFFDVEYNAAGLQQRQSFFAFALALLLFTSTEALPIFLDERQIYIRESSRGAYRTSSYVLANAVVFVPFLFALALIFGTISYFMVGLTKEAGGFFMFITVLFLTLAVANSYVIFWGGFVPNFIAGNTIVTATTAFMFLFSGFFIPRFVHAFKLPRKPSLFNVFIYFFLYFRGDIPKYWIWLHYLSNFKYPIELLEHNEYSRLRDICWNGGSISNCTQTSQDVLESYSAGSVSFTENILIMIFFFVAYRVFFFIALRIQTAKVRK